jgi:hypothetical protein
VYHFVFGPTTRRDARPARRSRTALGAIALLALSAVFTLARRDELAQADTHTPVRQPQPALATAN